VARILHRHRILFAVLGALALLFLGAALGALVLLSGGYSTEATKQHYRLTHRILDLGLRYSVNAAVENIEPPPLDDPRLVLVGLACYEQHCIQCHGASGVPRQDFGMGMLPTPADLAQSGREWSSSALYYIIKKGVRMTGMPAWEFQISEGGLWATTAYVRALPYLTRRQAELLRAAPTGSLCPRPDDGPDYSEERAKVLFRQYSCHACHQIEGIVGPKSHVGPPLSRTKPRSFIGGVLPGTPQNFVRWVLDPQSVSPQTMMPDLDVLPAHASQMSTYLYGRQP
jgi:mono/diheme cytochrome c family protein